MKKLLFLLTLVASLAAFSPLAEAKKKDKDKDKEEEKEKKRWKEMRDDVREIREQYSRLSDLMRTGPVSNRLREQISYIGNDVQRISAQFERGRYDHGDLHESIARAEDSMNRARTQVVNEQAQANRRYYGRDDDRRDYDRNRYDRGRYDRDRD